MLRHSPLPPLILSAALTLGLALTGARTDASIGPAQAKPASEAPAVRRTAATPPDGDGVSRAIEARHPGLRAL